MMLAVSVGSRLTSQIGDRPIFESALIAARVVPPPPTAQRFGKSARHPYGLDRVPGKKRRGPH